VGSWGFGAAAKRKHQLIPPWRHAPYQWFGPDGHWIGYHRHNAKAGVATGSHTHEATVIYKAVFAALVFALFYVLVVMGYIASLMSDEIKLWNKGRCWCGGSLLRTPSFDDGRSRAYRCDDCGKIAYLEVYRPGV